MNFKSYFKDKIPKMADQRLKLRDLMLLGGSVNKTPPAEDTHESTNPATSLRPGVQGLEPGLREGLPGTRKEGTRESE